MKHIKIQMILCSLVLLSSVVYSIGPSLFEMLTYDITRTQQLVVFEKSNPGFSAISRVRMHFLSASDCYSGYIGFYDNSDEAINFTVRQFDNFGLSAASVYKAALEVVGDDRKLEKDIHSVLIRLITGKRQFAYFTGTCNDQDVNCCIAIECSRASGVCLPRNAIDVQSAEIGNHFIKSSVTL